MIRFRLVLTVLLMFAALFSVQATAASSMAVIQTQSSVLVGAEVFSQFSDFQPKAANTAVSSHLSVSKQVVMLAADQHPQGSGFESLQPRLTVSNSSLFLYPSQVEPNYAAIFEFFVPSLARQLYLQPLEPPTRLPWFVSYDGKKSRLSGWKDANLQYRAVLTYHS